MLTKVKEKCSSDCFALDQPGHLLKNESPSNLPLTLRTILAKSNLNLSGLEITQPPTDSVTNTMNILLKGEERDYSVLAQ